jgi:hypothetical protein
MRRLVCTILVASILPTCDPVQSHAVDALGPETPGVRKGPLHRPGQPCTLCHDGTIGNPPEFTVAGTIFVNPGADLTPAEGATVTLQSSDGSQPYSTDTNAAGNFYVVRSDYTPVYPLTVSVTYGRTTVKMVSLIHWAASCGYCHVDPAGAKSPGHIFIPADGVAP